MARSSGTASGPDLDAPPPTIPVPDGREFALLLGREDAASAELAAIALPREVVLAHRRLHRRRLPDLRRMELPQPLAALAHRAPRLLLALPSLLMFAVALWAAVTGIGSLAQVVRLVFTAQFARAADALSQIDASGRLLLACVGYFALLAALRPLARGLLGSGRSRLALLLGLVVALPSAWLFIAGEELAAGTPPLSQLPAPWWRSLVIALALQAILLAVVSQRERSITPPAAIQRVSARDRVADDDDLRLDDPPIERLPLVRFGPPVEAELPPLTDTQAMRVAGLLHALSRQEAPEREASAHQERDETESAAQA